MKLYAPHKTIWISGIVFGLVGLVGQSGSIDFLTEYSNTLLWVGWLQLAIGPLFAKKA